MLDIHSVNSVKIKVQFMEIVINMIFNNNLKRLKVLNVPLEHADIKPV